MGRSPCCEKVGLKRGPWTSAEDRRLICYIQTHGEGSWRSLPKAAGLLRCGKSCRLRWFNYLRPDLKRGNISPEEEKIIIHLHAHLGNRWALIASKLPGRTDNEIKNHWNAHIKKRLRAMGIDPETHTPFLPPPPTTSSTQNVVESTKAHQIQMNNDIQIHINHNNIYCMHLEANEANEQNNNLQSIPSVENHNIMPFETHAFQVDGNNNHMQSEIAVNNHSIFLDSQGDVHLGTRVNTSSIQSHSTKSVQLSPKVDNCSIHNRVDLNTSSMHIGVQRGDYYMQMENIGANETMNPNGSKNISNKLLKVYPCDLGFGQEGKLMSGLERQLGTMVDCKRANFIKGNDKHSAREVPSRLATTPCGENKYMGMPKFSKETLKECQNVYNSSVPYIVTTNEDITLPDSPLNLGTPIVPQEDLMVPSRTSSKSGGECKSYQLGYHNNHVDDPLQEFQNGPCGAHDSGEQYICNNSDTTPSIDHEENANITWNMLEGDIVWHQGSMQLHTSIDHENLLPFLGSPLVGDSSLLWGTFEDNMLFCTRPSSPPWPDFICS